MRQRRWSNVCTTSSPERHSDSGRSTKCHCFPFKRSRFFLPLLMDVNHHHHHHHHEDENNDDDDESRTSSSGVGQWLKCPARILSSRHRLWWLISAIFLWTNINITASLRHRLKWLISTRGSFFPGYFGYFPPQVNLPIYPPSRRCSDTLFSLQKRGWFLLQS